MPGTGNEELQARIRVPCTPGKRKKISKVTQPAERFHCLECLELALQGKREERFTMVCRADQSSVKRHKERWHKISEGFTRCTVVPQTALEVKELRSKYKQVKQPNSAQSLLTTHPNSQNIAPPPLLSKIDEEEISCRTLASGNNEIFTTQSSGTFDESLETSLNTSKSPTQSAATLDSAATSHQASKKQTTLLCYAETGKSDDGDRVASLEGVMDAIGSLSLKVDNITRHHSSLIQLAFEDDDTRKSVMAMRKVENVLQLAKLTQLIEFFYDEESQTAILRCLPCYKVHLASKPTLGKLTPFQASRIINSSGSGTLSSGILFKQETTRLLIEGHNATWYRQKNVLINHLCQIGEGARKGNGRIQKGAKATGNENHRSKKYFSGSNHRSKAWRCSFEFRETNLFFGMLWC